jgi:hypothetical protein
VYGACFARALDALVALEARVLADLVCGPVATETVPFARPQQGSLYEGDTLTWRFYHTNAGCVVHAIGSQAYGTALTRALYAGLFGYQRQTMLDDTKTGEEKDEIYAYYDEHTREHPASVDDIRAALLRVPHIARHAPLLLFFWALLRKSPF